MGDLLAMVRAMSSAVSSASSGSVSSASSPASKARWASIGSPPRIMRIASDLPTVLASRWVPPAPGMMPSLISG